MILLALQIIAGLVPDPWEHAEQFGVSQERDEFERTERYRARLNYEVTEAACLYLEKHINPDTR